MTCSFSWSRDPNGYGGVPYFYWYNDMGGTASAVVHVWLEGWCNDDDSPSNPEPACPGVSPN